ncbi:hypothetical protein BpHYR1_049473 [Brachionus plicatilis]|uniref:Uncharacterized protein n=1 Tax=Brachionus plicatilis TaxID=10195 RepID=A0A3M7RDU4_BRAPC|nr:hypothetical protein BpHYR1_049473 [Brachionus plicatilis]
MNYLVKIKLTVKPYEDTLFLSKLVELKKWVYFLSIKSIRKRKITLKKTNKWHEQVLDSQFSESILTAINFILHSNNSSRSYQPSSIFEVPIFVFLRNPMKAYRKIIDCGKYFNKKVVFMIELYFFFKKLTYILSFLSII